LPGHLMQHSFTLLLGQMWSTGLTLTYVAKFENVFLTLDKSRDSELENDISYTTMRKLFCFESCETCKLTFEKMALKWFGTYLRAHLCLHPFSIVHTLLRFSPTHLFKDSLEATVCSKQPMISRLRAGLILRLCL
jgi:hypothetical protein